MTAICRSGTGMGVTQQDEVRRFEVGSGRSDGEVASLPKSVG